MLGALLVALLIAIIASSGGQLDLPVVGDVRRWFTDVNDEAFLLGTAVVLGVFFLLRVFVHLGYTYVKHRTAHNAGARLGSRLAQGYLRLPYAFHLRRSSAELVRNAHQTVEDLSKDCFLPIVQVLGESIVVAGLVTVMLVTAPGATLVAVAFVGGAALLLLKVVQPRLKRLGAVRQEMRRRTLASLQQSLFGIRDIKILGGEDHFARAYRRNRRALARANYLRGTANEMPRHIIETAVVSFILLLMSFSILTDVATERLLTTMGLFAYVGLRMMPSLQKIIHALNDLRFSGSAIDQVHADLVLIEEADRDRPAFGDLRFTAALRLEGVSFTYEQTAQPAISDVELTIRPGEMIGICGPTGGGKTTLTDLVTGILEPTSGRVTVDGVNVQDALPAWFSMLGIVPQMVFLSDDTLRRNIALGRADEDIDESALWECVQLAQLEEFITSLPEGLDTEVGERGVRISGGQRQRIAIARALYRRPEVLIFDEGTSALDNTTEAVLMSSLERLRGTRTIMLVAHRLSTVRGCDRIVYLEQGRVAGLGTFNELRSTNAGFRALTIEEPGRAMPSG